MCLYNFANKNETRQSKFNNLENVTAAVECEFGELLEL